MATVDENIDHVRSYPRPDWMRRAVGEGGPPAPPDCNPYGVRLRVEVGHLASISCVAREVVGLVGRTDTPVEFSYRGVLAYASWADSAWDVEQRYRRLAGEGS